MNTWLDLHDIRTRDLICEAQAARTRRLARRRRPATRRPTR
ncbi:hypothetical protein [Georgenia thermotolerans]|nr:hypothetical protein [Georgenia thermotolerans]